MSTPFFKTKDVITLAGVVASVILPKLFFDVEEEIFEQTVEVDIPADEAEETPDNVVEMVTEDE